MKTNFLKRWPVLFAFPLGGCAVTDPLALQIAATSISSQAQMSEKPVFIETSGNEGDKKFRSELLKDLRTKGIRTVETYRARFDQKYSVSVDTYPYSKTVKIESPKTYVYCNIPKDLDMSEHTKSFCYERGRYAMFSAPERTFLDLFQPSNTHLFSPQPKTIVHGNAPHVHQLEQMAQRNQSTNSSRLPAPVKIESSDNQKRWTLFQGVSLRNQVIAWGKLAGWTVRWPIELDWLVPNSSTFIGPFDGRDGVLAQLTKALNVQGKEAHLVLYKGNKTAIITTSRS